MRKKFLKGILAAFMLILLSGMLPCKNSFYITMAAEAKNGLVEENGATYYYKDGKKMKGLQTINGYKYLFDPTTKKMLTGKRTYNGKTYYFSVKSGKALKGLITIKGNKYYFHPTYYTMQTGFKIIDGKKYLFSTKSGVALSGVRTYNGNKYYFSKKTKAAAKGLITVGNAKYYAGDNCVLKKGLQNITSGSNSGRYLFDSTTRKMMTGWQEYTSDGKTRVYYFDPSTGKAVTGIVSLDGRQYYFHDEYATLQKGYILVRNGKRYYLDSITGEIKTGVFLADKNYFYFDPSTESGYGERGLQEIDGKTYYIHPEYGFACLGLYYLNDDQECGLRYFATENETNPGEQLSNTSITIGGNILVSVDENGIADCEVLGEDQISELFTFGLSKLGTPYGEAEKDILNSPTYQCSSFVAACYKAIGMENAITRGTPAEQAKMCEQSGQLITNAANLQQGDLLFWNRDSCIDENCEFRVEERHLHHVSIFLGQGSDGYYYQLEATEMDPSMCVRVARIKNFGIYPNSDEAETDFYISVAGRVL